MKDYEVIIVGGGIIGKAIALTLGSLKKKVLLIDPATKDCGSASFAAGAMLGAFAEITATKVARLDLEETKFRIEAAKRYPEFVKLINDISGENFQINMGTFIAANNCNEKDHINLDYIVSELETHNYAYQRVTPRDIPGYKPHLNSYSNNAIFIPEEGSVATHELMRVLEIAIQNLPDIEYLDDLVVEVLHQQKPLAVRTTKNLHFQANHIILAAGIGVQNILNVSQLSDLLGVGLIAGKGSSLIIESEVNFPYVIRTPNRDFACGTHVVPLGNGRLYVGATNRVESKGYSLQGVTAGELHGLLNTAIHEINVSFRTSMIERMQYGSRPLTTDGFPVIGKTSIEGLMVATGTYRNGILMAPLIAKIIASEITPTNTVIHNPFSMQNRFELLESREIDHIIHEGVSHLVSFIQEPNGNLPYNRRKELENFITLLLKIAFNPGTKYDELINVSKQSIHKSPLSETICQLFYEFNSFEMS